MKKNNQSNHPLQKKLGIKFKNSSLLQQALVHRSFLNETKQKGMTSNERLEFLGDAVLEFVISQLLYHRFPIYPEGILTNLRSNIVRTTSLAKIALNLKIGQYLKMSRGEKESGGQKNLSILADTLEAVIGAIYLDQGVAVTTEFISTKFEDLINQVAEKKEIKDAKSLLQEKIQAKFKITPIYQIIKEAGPDHDKIFTAAVMIDKRRLATGQGKSKQTAEETAAQKALKKIS